LGTGLPTSPNVHEVARQVRPDARVVYVDNDPMVTAHGRALCATDDGVIVLDGDIRCPRELFADQQLTGLIDFSEPAAILCVSVLPLRREGGAPPGVRARARGALAPGSYLALRAAAPGGPGQQVPSEIAAVFQGGAPPGGPRSAGGIGGFFTGLDLIEPGLVD